jgi:hypothetical protein
MNVADPALRMEMEIERDRSGMRISYRDRAASIRMVRPDRLEWQDHFGQTRRAHFTVDGMTVTIVDGKPYGSIELRALILDGLKLPRVREEVLAAALDLWLETTARQWVLKRPDPPWKAALPVESLSTGEA